MKKNIYLVEDNYDISDLVKYLLSEIGYEVEAFNTIAGFRQAVDVALPDLFILDIMLPDGNGQELCRELKADDNTRFIPVILMSAHAGGKEIATEVCADDFIGKPFDINDFTEMVQRQITFS